MSYGSLSFIQIVHPLFRHKLPVLPLHRRRIFQSTGHVSVAFCVRYPLHSPCRCLSQSQRRIHLLPVVPSLLRQADVSAHLFKEPDAAQLRALREQAEAGKGEAELQAYKVEQMKTIYQMLVLAYGEPVQEFLWAPRGKDGKLLSELKKYTPMEFYKEYCAEAGDLQKDYVMLMNDPSRPYNKVYEIDMDRHMHEGHNWLYLNLDIKDLAPIAIASLQDSTQMYFSCDVGKFLDSKKGILDIQAWDYNSLLGTTFGMNKKQRIQTRDSGSSHAMTLMAVDLDEKGNPIKWKVENSWGAASGHNGYLIMTNEWFNEYMFRVVVNKKYMPKKFMKLMEQKPTLLPAWDPMFMEEQ